MAGAEMGSRGVVGGAERREDRAFLNACVLACIASIYNGIYMKAREN